jgi:nucleoside-diphosphate-sugar epimerase
VRSHNVARVNKSYRSFGDKFDTVVIDDLITSDLLAAVKGMKRAASVSSSDTEHIPGVDAIIHVASPSSATPNRDVVLEAAVTGTTRMLDAALVVGVKKLVITESAASLAVMDDYYKDKTITEMCE